MSILIKNGRVIDPENSIDGFYDLLIDNGKVKKIEKNIICSKEKKLEVIDAKNKIVAPGFVDAHVHFRVPGQEFKEDLISGSKAALKGGVTSVATMPNTNPVLDDESKLNNYRDNIEKSALINIFPIASVTKALKGEKLVCFENLKDKVVAFSDDGMPIMDSLILEKALKKLPDNQLIISHCEDHDESKKYLEKPWPCVAEYKMVHRNIELIKKYTKKMHLAHLSCSKSIDLVKEAKKNKLPITCEVTPHHFALSNDMIDMKNTCTKVNPPIRSKKDKNSIIKAIKEDVIDIIATDHAPHDEKSKSLKYSKAAFGISGIEYSFSLAYTYLVLNENISLNKIISMMTNRPAKILNISKGNLSVGSDADVVILNLKSKEKINKNKFISKGKNTPFHGIEVSGLIEKTLVNGKIMYRRDDKNEY